MHSMSAVFDARIFDGRSAQPLRVQVVREGDVLRFGEETLAISELRRVDGKTGLTLHRPNLPDWRMILPPEAGADFRDVIRLHAATARHWRWIGGSLAAVAVVSMLLWSFGGTLLAGLAPLVPQDVAQAVGDQYAGVFAPEERQCNSPAGTSALNELMGRIKPQTGPTESAHVTVVDDETVNAITLPGGQIILFRGLIDQAQSADEVAGVLAHELGHVQHYHGNQALIRHFGLGVFLQGVGGNVGTAASTGLFLSNGRAAEREADDEAIKLLRNGEVSATGVSDFFARMGGANARDGKPEKGEAVDAGTDLTALLSTHPGDADRRRRFAESARTYRATPILSDAEWAALKAICGSPSAKRTLGPKEI